MTISSAILIAGTGLQSVSKGLAVASQNIANANTPGYARESVAYTAASAGSNAFGVITGPATREIDVSLEASVFEQNAEVASQQTISSALAAIDATQGTTAAGNDLASEVGALSNAFSTLSADPSNAAGQSAVVVAANALAATINTTANAYQTGRQTAQNSIVSDVATLNTTLTQIGALSKQIIAAKVNGTSTADLENQRDVAEGTAAQLAGIKFLSQNNGDVVALLGGDQINLQSSTGPFTIANATLSAANIGPALTLAGQDVGALVTTGTIGGNLSLRDNILPAGQAGLDEFAETLATRLGNQGLQLFTDASGAVPAGGGTPAQSTYLGFANTIQVNPAVTANASLVRDGTNAVVAGTGGAAGFTPNPAGGPSGFATLINNVLQYGFGADAQAGTPQPPPATTGLGVNGTVTLNYQTSGTIGGFAANLVASQSTAVNAAATALTNGTGLQTTLQAKLQAGSGVSIDSELSNLIVLQNAYGANAKVLTAAQSLWNVLYDAVSAAIT
jgi:flagellar hook-associated protein 1 FlgK